MNKLAFNRDAARLGTEIFAAGPGGDASPRVDGFGRPVIAPGAWEIESGGLGIRPLSAAADSASITSSNLDIRSLTAVRDGIAVARQASATGFDSAPVGLIVPVYLLPTDMSRTRENAFAVANLALLSLSVRIILQIAPVNADAYYVNDGSSYDLVGGGVQIFTPTKPLRWARIRASALLSTATVEVYFFGRT